MRANADNRNGLGCGRLQIRLHLCGRIHGDDAVHRHIRQKLAGLRRPHLADDQLMLRLLDQPVQLPRHMVVVGGNLVGNPQRDDARALAFEGAGVGIRAIAHFVGGRQNALARLLGNLRVAGQGKRDKLPRQTDFLGNFFLRNHKLSSYST
jgi:hypothetical protein